MNELLIIMPAYNEAENIAPVIGSLKACAPEAEILVVDDGSRDSTAEICRELGVKTARHRVNLGLAEAVRTGMKYALRHGYRYAMQFDADGQHDPEAVTALLSAAREGGYNIVIGSRYLTGSPSSFFKRLGGRAISFCIRLTSGAVLKDPTSGMRLYDRKVMERFASCPHDSPEPDTLACLIRKGMRAAEVQVRMREREHGRSYLDITESVRYMFRMCTSILLVQWFR